VAIVHEWDITPVNSNSGDITVALDAAAASGQRVWIILSATSPTTTWSEGGGTWTELYDNNGHAAFFKDIGAAESDPVFTPSNSERTCALGGAISGHDTGTAPVAANEAVGTSNAPNPPNSDSPSGTAERYYAACYAVAFGGSGSYTEPSGYSTVIHTETGGAGNGSGGGVAHLIKTTDDAELENPGAFSMGSVNKDWSARTIMFEPAGLAVTGGTIGSGSTLFAPSVAVGAVGVTGGTIASTVTLFPPTVSQGAQAITGGHVSSTLALFAPSVSPGPVSVTGGTVAAGAALFAPTVIPQPVSVVGGHVSTTAQTFPPSVAVGAVAVTGGTIAATSSLFPPSVSLGGTVVGGHVSSTAQLFPPAVAVGAVSVTGPTIAAGTALFAPSVATGPVAVVGGTVTPGSSLAAPSVTPGPVGVVGGHVSTSAALYAPAVTPGSVPVVGGTIASGVQLFPPLVGVTLVTAGLGEHTSILIDPSATSIVIAASATSITIDDSETELQ